MVRFNYIDKKIDKFQSGKKSTRKEFEMQLATKHLERQLAQMQDAFLISARSANMEPINYINFSSVLYFNHHCYQ